MPDTKQKLAENDKFVQLYYAEYIIASSYTIQDVGWQLSIVVYVINHKSRLHACQ